MNNNFQHKIKPHHLQRKAYLYIRQSTLKQVIENIESTERQYALRERAVSLGWPIEDVIVIDSDLGKSGSTASNRNGFKKLVADVGMGQAGIVIGLEVSRLARNCSDWHRLLEICALTETLILDEDGLYDPSHFNDRLLLGLKGTMSEAELHVLRARLRGGLQNKASKGELLMALSVGFVHTTDEKIIKDPDKQVQETISTFFKIFRRTGTASTTVRDFRKKSLLFPRRPRIGARQGILMWGELTHWQALRVLHNPFYAGAYAFGRTRTQKLGDGKIIIKSLPMEQWHTLIHDNHDGYITWDEYENNLQRLRENAQAHGHDRRKSPAHNGPALLQGIVMCGKCGRRMTIRYHHRRGKLSPDYMCQSEGIQKSEAICQQVSGGVVDETISQKLLEAVTPAAINIAIAVQRELESRTEEVDQLRRRTVERARYEADIAKSRFMQVDPNNRLVADALEAEWNCKLKLLYKAQEDYEMHRQKEVSKLNDKIKAEILEIATNFPKVWNNPNVPHRERKRLIRLLIEDVTLFKGKEITINIRFRGGKTKMVTIPKPLPAPDLKRTDAELVSKIDSLLELHTEAQIASILNADNTRSSEGKKFTPILVAKIRRSHSLKDRYSRLRERGYMEREEIAKIVDISISRVAIWRRHGLLKGIPADRKRYLYHPPNDRIPMKRQGVKLSERVIYREVTSINPNEVHHEA